MSKYIKILTISLLLILASGQAQAGLFDDRPSFPSMEGVKSLRDISYGSDKKQKYDVFIPPQANNAPVIFMVHGGGWRVGDKTNSRIVENKGNYFLSKGYIFVSVNYPMIPQANPVQQLGNVMSALADAQKHANEWGGNPNKFILMGHSSGAHLAALLNSNPQKMHDAGIKPVIGAVILDSAAFNVTEIMEAPHYNLYDGAFGKDKNFWIKASPIEQLKAGAAPMMLVCSSKRNDSCGQAYEFEDKAKKLGVSVKVLPEDKTHSEINFALGTEGDYTEAVEGFIESLLK